MQGHFYLHQSSNVLARTFAPRFGGGCMNATEQRRPDRGVALEQTDAISVPFAEILELLLKKPELISMLIDVFCRALKEAYAQVNTLALDDTVHRLIKILVGLAKKIGQPSGSLVEIPTYLTQEEIAHMAAARRERISTALNSLRRQRMVHYSARGHLMVNVSALRLKAMPREGALRCLTAPHMFRFVGLSFGVPELLKKLP
jgi:hypothetical protein